MSEEDRPQFSGRISLGNVLMMAFGALCLAAAWGSVQSDMRAMADKIIKGERIDEQTAKLISELSGAVIELRADLKAIRSENERQGRQLDRLEQLLRGPTRPPGNP
jgi:HAMP domain-containing protein